MTGQSDAELANEARKVLSDAMGSDDPAVAVRAAKETLSFVDQSVLAGPLAGLSDEELLNRSRQLVSDCEALIHG